MRQRLETADYYLGKLVGQIIYHLYLPTLSVNMLKSPTVIQVTEEETAEAERLNQLLNNTYYDATPKDKWGNKESTRIAHKNWIDYINELGRKYLPEKLHCRFERIDVVDMAEFKDGLREYLWNTDLSWYDVEDDFWVQTGKHSWFSEVVLTLRISN